MAHALAPMANILLVEASSTGQDLYTEVNYAREFPGVSVVSMSWGCPEFSGEQSYDQYFQTPAGHNGVTFVAATGDNGAPGNYPAFSPFVLAVGGTYFSGINSSGNYTEAGWWSSGGGISKYENQLFYQRGVATQSTTARTIPDVAFDAGSAVSVFDSYDFGATPWVGEQGTSVAAPCWSALVAIADQGVALRGGETMPTLDTEALLYQLHGNSAYFNDIVTGNNGYPAEPGYDLVTGLGTPVASFVAVGMSGDIETPPSIAPTGTVSTTTPTFQWSAVPGATGYQITMVDPQTGEKVAQQQVLGTNSFTPAYPVLYTPGNPLTWYVQAFGTIGGLSPPSDTLSFTLPPIGTPENISPAANSSVTTVTPTFQWSAVAGASSTD